MSAATVETLDFTVCTTEGQSSPARAEASRANGRLSRGPLMPEGKANSRRNGCKDGLTGKGVVLPEAAAAEVDRREAEFARDFRPQGEVERELVRQMALGAWRSRELAIRIVEHAARVNAARFANWEPDERLAAVELGRRLGEDPEAAVAQLKRTSAGCDWLIGRWELLGNGLLTAAEGGPDCQWTDADLALAVDLLGRPKALRHLDERAGRLESLRDRARAGSAEAVAELRGIIEDEVAGLEERGEETFEEIERPRLCDWRAGLEIDLGAEGTRLRRYEAAADRLFRSAWRKLEQLRKERGEPLMPGPDCGLAPEPAARCNAPAAPPPAESPPAATPARLEAAFPAPSLRGAPAATVLDFSVGGSPRPGMNSGVSSRDKTNPAPGRHAKRGRDLLLGSLA
jgi:hypothetical protein